MVDFRRWKNECRVLRFANELRRRMHRPVRKYVTSLSFASVIRFVRQLAAVMISTEDISAFNAQFIYCRKYSSVEK